MTRIPIPRRSCTGLRPEPIQDYPATTLAVITTHPNAFGFLRLLCLCGRELEWGGDRWGCGNCE